MKLSISEPEPRDSGPILVCDEALNDIAEFYHNEHATVGQSYETALKLALILVEGAGLSETNHSGFCTIRTIGECTCALPPADREGK